jgi:hypothetical protein
MLAFIAQGFVNTFKISPYVDISPNSPCTVLDITLVGCKDYDLRFNKTPHFCVLLGKSSELLSQGGVGARRVRQSGAATFTAIWTRTMLDTAVQSSEGYDFVF